MIKNLKSLFKFGIVVFVIISAWAGYALGLPVEQGLSFAHFFFFTLGTFFISSGSLGLNQVQEVEKDAKMPRTQNRPIPSGVFSKKFALTLCLTHIIVGLAILYFLIKPLTAMVGASIILLYNGPYTLHWKGKWAFAAVPGAIPGALPGVLGLSAVDDHIFGVKAIYLFLIMFLWQMPHFWTLAIRFREDYAKGDFPVLPVVIGKERTIYHISLYVFAYALLAIMSPFFVEFYYAYFILVIPFALKVVWEFIKYYRAHEEKAWLAFFLWTNFSVIVFLFAPVLDKWLPLLIEV